MKRKVSALLLFMFLLGVSACGQAQPAISSDKQAEPVATTEELQAEDTTPEPTSTPEPTPEPEPTIDDYFKSMFGLMSPEMRKAIIQNQNDTQNRAEYTITDGWIYGLGMNKNGDICAVKWRDNLSEKTVLTKGQLWTPYVRDAYLYGALYQNKETGIYRMRVSGEDLELIFKAHTDTIQMWDDTIYFTDRDQGTQLFRMNLDGTDLNVVIDKEVYCWYVFGDYVLYQDDADNESLHLMKIGGEDIKLNDQVSYSPIYDGEYIYYIKRIGDDRSIWRISIDGSDDTKIAEYDAYEIALYNDKIYFINIEDNDRVYAINKDGTGLTMISQEKQCENIQFMGDILKYDVTYTKGNTLYLDKVKLCEPDGTLLHTLVE